MTVPAVTSILDAEMEQDTSTSFAQYRLGGMEIQEGRFYPVTISKIDFLRDQASGKIMGWPPDRMREGKQRYPRGRMKLIFTCMIDGNKGDIKIDVPYPWNDTDGPPWDGSVDESGKLHGKANLFTDEQAMKLRGPIKVSTTGMGSRLSEWAMKLGWQAQSIPTGGGEPKANTLKVSWFLNRPCMVGRFVQKNRGGVKDWIVAPPSTEATVRSEIDTMLVALSGQKTQKGEPLDNFESVRMLLGIPDAPTAAQLEEMRQSLVLTCQARNISVGTGKQAAQAL